MAPPELVPVAGVGEDVKLGRRGEVGERSLRASGRGQPLAGGGGAVLEGGPGGLAAGEPPRGGAAECGLGGVEAHLLDPQEEVLTLTGGQVRGNLLDLEVVGRHPEKATGARKPRCDPERVGSQSRVARRSLTRRARSSSARDS